MYKLSSANKIWTTKGGEKALFNSLSKACITLDDESYDLLVNKCWDSFEDSMIDFFLKSYILIEEDISEKDIFKFEQANLITMKDPLTIFLVPSRKCNLACTYCIQNNLFDISEHGNITREVIDGYYNWIEEKIQNWGVKEIRIYFYGGEPLTTDASVLKYLFEKFEKLSINPKYIVISNGIAIKGYRNLLNYISHFKVTLDGKKEKHDKRRIDKNGNGTYDRILNNIKYYLDLDPNNKVTIRVNVDKDNRDSLIEDVKDILEDLPLKQVDMQFSPIAPFNSEVNDFDIHGDISETAKAICDCYEYVSKYEMEPYMWVVNCGVKSMSFWSFDTEGTIYKCPSYIGVPESAVTSIFQERMNGEFYRIINEEINEKCYSCNYIGICGGGCFHQKELSENLPCRKSFFDIFIPRILEIKHNL